MSILKSAIKYTAFSLIEMLLAIALFSMVAGSVGIFAVDGSRASRNARQKIRGSLLLQEQGNALLANKRDLWYSIAENTDDGPKYLDFVNNKYVVSDGSQSVGDINISFEVENVFRDVSGNIVTDGSGELDIHSRRVLLIADWVDFLGNNQTVQLPLYLNDWNTERFEETFEAEFNNGTTDETFVTNDAGGEVILTSVVNDDWCTPELTQSLYDLPGSGIPTMLSSVPGNAYLGTSGSSGAVALQSVEIDHDTSPATINVEGTFSGYNTNAIFGEENYAYLATTNDSKEVVILDVSTTPFQEIGYFNAGGSADAYSIYVSGNVGYVAQGKVIRTFDLSSKTGSRPQLDSVTATSFFSFGNAHVSDISVRGNYLFAALFDDWYEMAILNVGNPSNISVSGRTDVNFQQTTDLFVNETGDRVYFGTDASPSFDEFFIIDTSSKSGNRPVIGSFDSQGMDVKGVTVIDSHKRAIIVGTSGEEYQVVDISNESNLTQCGGLQVDSGLNGVSTITLAGGDSYSYIIGNNASAEFRIVKGGPGNAGGGSSGIYSENGEFTSQVFDSGKTNTYYLSIDWGVNIPANTDLKLQLRTSNNSDMSASTSWVGPDATAGTFFTTKDGESLPSVLNGKRYFQYKLYLSSDTTNTPVFDQFNLNYE